MEWIEWSGSWPDWGDAGKRVQVEYDDGTNATGKLTVSDFFPDGEGDEVPVFAIISDDGTEHSFADHKRWRFVTPNAKNEGQP